MTKQMKFEANFSGNILASINNLIANMAKLNDAAEKGNARQNDSTAKAAAMTLRIQKQAALAEAALVSDRFQRLINVQEVKHQQLLASLGKNLAAQQAAEALNAAKIAKIHMDQKNFPDTPFQRLLGQLGQVASRLGTVPPGAGKAETALRTLGGQAGALAVGGLAKASSAALKAGEAVKDMGARVASSIGAKDIVKFLGLKQAMEKVEQLGKVVFASAIEQSPHLTAVTETLKSKMNSLVTEIAGKIVPILTAGFDFLLRHWNQVRFGIELGAAVIEDAFYGIKGTFEFLTVGILNGAKVMAMGLEAIHLVAKGTAQSLGDEASKMAQTAAADFAKTNHAATTLASGLKGLGKEVEANVDLFGQMSDKEFNLESRADFLIAKFKNEKEWQKHLRDLRWKALDQEEKDYEQHTQFMKQAQDILANGRVDAMKEGIEKQRAAIKEREREERMDLVESGAFFVMNAKEKQEALFNLSKKYKMAENRLNAENAQSTLAASSQMFSGLAALAATAQMKDRGNRLRWKAMAIAEAAINTTRSVMQVFADSSIPNIYAKIAAAAGAAAFGTAQVIQIKNQKFAAGGIVQGPFSSGDRIPIQANAGEMVLNRDQQAQLFAMANGRGGGGGSVTVNVHPAPGMTASDAREFGQVAATAYREKLVELEKMNRDIQKFGVGRR